MNAITDLFWHAVRLMALKHDGDGLPNDREHALWLTAAAMVLSSLIDANHAMTAFDYALFTIRVSAYAYLMLIGAFRMMTYSALISIFSNGVRLLWLANGASHDQLGWVSAWDAFAWVRAALMIGLI